MGSALLYTVNTHSDEMMYIINVSMEEKTIKKIKSNDRMSQKWINTLEIWVQA